MQKIGNNLMMAGIVLQVVILLAFATASADFLLRLHRALGNMRATLSPEAQVLLADTKFQLFAAGLVLAFLTIFTRCCYRIAEMAGGWANPIMQNETDFVVLDGVMVLIASLCLTILHPGFCFPRLATGRQSGLGGVEKRVSDTSLEEA
jgi:hypothetical protein